MIKINLLPIKAARKREYVKQQLILALVLIVATLVGLYLWWNAVDGDIANRQKQIKQAEQQIQQYNKAIGEVEKYKGMEAALNRTLMIIENLFKGKTGPVRVLDRLSRVIPKQVWLTKWEEKSGTVTIEGEALSNKHVGNFMTLLDTMSEAGTDGQPASAGAKKPVAQKSFFSAIRLVETKSDEDKKYKLSYVSFKITLKVNYAI
ncbi:MAG TPA: PilN domain-containing protein [Myxococcota bacterium]|nr:PilN domain-containing protein [Myxococcota bacterium]